MSNSSTKSTKSTNSSGPKRSAKPSSTTSSSRVPITKSSYKPTPKPLTYTFVDTSEDESDVESFKNDQQQFTINNTKCNINTVVLDDVIKQTDEKTTNLKSSNDLSAQTNQIRGDCPIVNGCKYRIIEFDNAGALLSDIYAKM